MCVGDMIVYTVNVSICNLVFQLMNQAVVHISFQCAC